MSADSEPDLQLEIGHVLLIDIVGYSRPADHQQSEQMDTLRTIVRSTEQRILPVNDFFNELKRRNEARTRTSG
jgi:hypothetical protein